jgi:hypothetical protein
MTSPYIASIAGTSCKLKTNQQMSLEDWTLLRPMTHPDLDCRLRIAIAGLRGVLGGQRPTVANGVDITDRIRDSIGKRYVQAWPRAGNRRRAMVLTST